MPKKRAEHVTLRLSEGKSVLLGGLARVHFISGLPFLLTFYLANAITIHPTPTAKVTWRQRCIPRDAHLRNCCAILHTGGGDAGEACRRAACSAVLV